jgi:hypothetical protein
MFCLRPILFRYLGISASCAYLFRQPRRMPILLSVLQFGRLPYEVLGYAL